jgi:crotonobetainyl-CoA:carnitine CoA-transferase CaiB-like acyl-CoA transferase
MQPLAGVKVLDLSRLLPGPFASLLLADMGATVDKVEDPGGGDYLRHMPPQIAGTSSIFLALNRGKRSAVIDLKKPAARDLFLRMVARYDVVLEQFRPGVLDRLGLSHATLLEKNPKLVVCALTGYGQDGPLAHKAGHDLNYIARAGILAFQGPTGAPPQPPGFQLADVSGGLYSVIGILGALRERDRTGKGQVVDISMLECAMGFAAASIGALFAGATLARGADALTGGIAPYCTYETKDGKYVTLASLEPKFWMGFANGVGLEVDMGALMPGPHQAALKEKVAAIFKSKTRAEWEDFSRAHDVCLEPALAADELMQDAHIRARGLFFELESPWGTIPQFRLPLTPKPSETTFRAPPKQGEHTAEILRECGESDASIAALRESGAIG